MAHGTGRADSQQDIYYQEREAQIYDLEYAWKTDDVEYWKGLAQEYCGRDGQALELGCGTLRVTLPMARAGIRVVGVDQSPYMLEIARKKMDAEEEAVQERVGLLEADMRNLHLEQKFNLIYVPFNTFYILRTIEDQLAVFETARRFLAPGGVLALDIFVPNVNYLVRPVGAPQWGLEVDQTLGDLGIRLQRDMVREVDPIGQRLSVTYRIKEYRDNLLDREWLSDLELTYVFPRELQHLVARAGFEFVHLWGDYDRTDFYKLQNPRVQLPVMRVKE